MPKVRLSGRLTIQPLGITVGFTGGTMATVRVRQLTKRHGDATIVRGVDLDIDEGELLAIVGPSGCGKTSILRMVAGLDPATSGEVLVDGVAVSHAHRGQRPISMMFQDAALYPHLRVRDNIGFPLRMAGVNQTTIRREVASIATALGIGAVLSRRPGQLSGGQRQRVAMARSLIRRPDILLMDEPMSNLDAHLRGELRATIGHLRQRLGITTLYVTHDQVEAMSLGDRIAVMRDGRIVQVGTPAEVYHDPVDAFVATFIGAPSMNLFLGRICTGDPIPTVTMGSARLPLDPARLPDPSSWDGRDVVVGVRPQALRFVDVGAVCDVQHIETLGDRRLVTATLPTGGVEVTDTGISVTDERASLTVETSADGRLGEAAWQASHLVADATDIHLFDPSSGRSLRADARGCVSAQAIRATT